MVNSPLLTEMGGAEVLHFSDEAEEVEHGCFIQGPRAASDSGM